MVSISVEQFENDPKGLLAQVAAGERVLVKRGDAIIAEIGPAAEPIAEPDRGARKAGSCRGQFVVPDDFDAPLPEKVLREFEGR